ncbi:branched-chain amino acid aminotransferase [Compostibacter hankyongensis]|uniref:Branched-chain-amino-acid aminotransferase n=1 Tax=Compostibacter hankyongensis TaxID=1007089 RepID=A0ABP8GAT2_9BACT
MEDIGTKEAAVKPAAAEGKERKTGGLFPVERVRKSHLGEVDFSNLGFGKIFADHMLVADFADGSWQPAHIVPYGEFSVSPANSALHYGQSIFEGIKAYRDEDGAPLLFRPEKNYERFLKSAERLAMPPVPEDIFLSGMEQLISLDRAWIPEAEGCSLYIRPFMFATDAFLGVRPSGSYRFMIINSPAGAYYNKPVKLVVQEKYVRAFPGGTGFAKSAGNYAGSLMPALEVQRQGYDQILWIDGIQHKYLQECGTMNFFVIIGDTAVTADLDEGTILDGVTRDTVIALMHEQGLKVEERPLSIDEVLEAYRQGTLREVFGTGTAAGISYVAEMTYREHHLQFRPEAWTIAPALLQRLGDVHFGKNDPHGWCRRID